MGFQSPTEEARYLAAVRENPKRPGERGDEYVARISRIVRGAYAEQEAVRDMPEAPPPPREPGEDDE